MVKAVIYFSLSGKVLILTPIIQVKCHPLCSQLSCAQRGVVEDNGDWVRSAH